MGGGSTSADVSRKVFGIEVTSAIEYKYFPIEDISAQVYTKMAAAQRQNFEENLEEQLAKIDPATLQLEQLLAENAPAVRKRTCWMNPFPKKWRSVYITLYFLNLSDQELLPGKEGREKGKNFEGVRSLSSTEHPNGDRLPE